MNAWMNYHHLFYFKSIAEEGSVSRAAEKLRLGQPTLSAQLKQLEEALGVALFERHHRKLELTEQGKVTLEYAKTIFRMGSELQEVLKDRRVATRPTLHIGSLDSVPKQVVLQMVKAALKAFQCQVTLSEGRSDEILRELGAHRVDLALINFLPGGTDAKGFYHRLISKKPVAIYGAPKFRHLRKGFPKSISGQPLIVPTYDGRLRQDIEHWAKLNDIELSVAFESQDVAMKKLLAVDGVGLLPAASHTVARQILSGDLVELGKIQGANEDLYLVTRQRKIENEVSAYLMKNFSL